MKVQRKSKQKSLSGSESDRSLLLELAESMEMTFQMKGKLLKPTPILEWAEGLDLGGRTFRLKDHEFQAGILKEDFPRQVLRKGSQIGLTETQVLKSMHGLLFGRYPQGVLYLFPSLNDVQDFSRGRFAPLITGNPQIRDSVCHTDAVGMKRVNESHIYFRGARATGKIEGLKRTSSSLKSIPVDRVVLDEADEFEEGMIELALERLGHSLIKEQIFLSTPSIPDYGIDKMFQESDQRVWTIRCQHCGAWTCLEEEFPNCLIDLNGKVIRACKECKREIFPENGEWVAKHPDRSKDLVGWWISQLNSMFVSPAEILKAFQNAGKASMQEFYNSKLGLPYVSAQNRLRVSDVLTNCGPDLMATKDIGPCAMGVDVGRTLHVVIGYKPKEQQIQICYIGEVLDFNDLYNLVKSFNVRSIVMDAEPEIHKAREFQQNIGVPTFLCDYISTVSGTQWDAHKKMVKVNRTELLDRCHEQLTSGGKIILPRRCSAVDDFAAHVSNVAKVLQENPETGQKEFKYRRLSGPDHYMHAFGYMMLAATRVGVSQDPYYKGKIRQEYAESEFNVFGKRVETRDLGFRDRRESAESDYDIFGRRGN